jgi:hypothetical protein
MGESSRGSMLPCCLPLSPSSLADAPMAKLACEQSSRFFFFCDCDRGSNKWISIVQSVRAREGG